MKLILLTHYCYDEPTFTSILGGLAKAYRCKGHEVIAAGQIDPLKPRPSRERADWGEIRRLGGLSTRTPVYMLRTFIELFFVLRGADFVHLHIGGDESMGAMANWLACEIAGVPFGVTLQDFSNPCFKPPGRLDRLFLKALLKRAEWVTALTNFIRRELSAAMPEAANRVRVVANGFDPQEERAAVPLCEDERPFVLCAARLAAYKGIDILLMAWRDVCARIDGVDLVLCGSDDLRDHYRGLARRLEIAERVRFLGPVDRPRIWSLMRACRCFVLASRQEAFGIAALEAMACGKAVVATRAGGLPEFIEHGKSGVLVPPRDVDALGRALLGVLNDAALREKLGAGARSAAANYHWQDAADSYLELIAQSLPADLDAVRAVPSEI